MRVVNQAKDRGIEPQDGKFDKANELEFTLKT